jgi:hypothetical protein
LFELSQNSGCYDPYRGEISLRRRPTVFIHARGPGLNPASDVAKALDGEEIVSEMTDAALGYQGSEPKESMGWFALVGFATGLVPFVGFCWPLLLHGANARSLPLATFAIVNPLVCAGLGCLAHRYPAASRWRTRSFFAIEPLTPRERQERIRQISTFVWAGFGMGIVTALAATSLEVACRGWSVLDLLIPALLIYPELLNERLQVLLCGLLAVKADQVIESRLALFHASCADDVVLGFADPKFGLLFHK